MRARTIPIIVTALLLADVSAKCAADNTKADENAVRDASRAYDTAAKAGDAATLNRLFADDVFFTDADGQIYNKKQIVSRLTDKNVKYEAIRTADVMIRLYGSTAVETGKVVVEGTENGKPFRESMRYTDVWSRSKGQWLLTTEHTCFIKARNH